MLTLNMADKWFKKENGELVWDQGVPERGEEVDQIVKELFTPNRTLKSKDGKEYGYHAVNYGENGSYVPISIKDGSVVLVEEERYKAASQPFLDKYGVNVFDNLIAQDADFTTRASASKGFEARNRIATPGVPFSQLGGVTPSKNDMVFVDLSGTGFDGGSFWMPGYLPAKGGTIRSVGIKGSAEEVDFVSMFKAEQNSFILTICNRINTSRNFLNFRMSIDIF
jgi:hypothetical protein